MSKSRSTTPTHNILPTNIPSESSTTPTISRRQAHEITPPLQPSGEREEPSLRPTFIRPPQSPPPEAFFRDQSRRPASSSPTDQPMAKRLRRESPQARETQSSRSSPSSDSQGGMADTEEAAQSPRSQSDIFISTTGSIPPKKKRTRTLTTPHQSAVLHALLAQSRFPTTAMREEVGRSIGLSARKVQIWFQNQRQKARRPRSESDGPLSRPPQYGPFPNAPDSMPISPYTMAPEHTPFHTDTHAAPYFRQGNEDIGHQPDSSAYPPEFHDATRERDPPSRLLGPGMPGLELRVPPPYGYDASPRSPLAGPSSAPLISSQYNRRLPSPSRDPSYRWSAPSSSHTRGRVPEHDPSRTLPPISFDSPPPTRHLHSVSGHYDSFTSTSETTPHGFRRSASPGQIFAHRLPEQQFGRPPALIPPPFTLQPQPQWDTSPFTSLPPTRASSSWSHHSSRSHEERSRSRSPRRNPEILQEGFGEASTSDPVPTGVTRTGRYDPVRATIVPYNPLADPSASSRFTENNND